MKIHRTLALVAVFGVVPLAPAIAGQGQSRQRGMDADRDGVITRGEWRGTAEGFRQFDLNRDGVLSGNEVQAASKDPSVTDEAARAREAAARVGAMDTDRDGVVTRAEWRGTAEGFRDQDTNRDSVLSGSELRASVVQDPSSTDEDTRRREAAAARFAGMDRDHDGVITRAEWRGGNQAFRQHDTNRDGVLSGTEVSQNQAESEAEARRREAINYRFTRADRDRDGRLERNEWSGNNVEFTRMDRNTDGIVTREEFAAASASDLAAPTSGERSPTAAYQAGQARGMAEGRDAGKADRVVNPAGGGTWDLEGQSELQQADSGYNSTVGARDEYQAGYRAGFRLGYKEGFGPRNAESRAYKAGHDRGTAEGRQAGKDDRSGTGRWDLEGQRELEQADSGYNSNVGPRDEYQAGYRVGFRLGYQEGFGRR